MVKTPFKYGRRRCIFCQRQPPEVSISKEHLFADWLREIFPRTAETTHTLGVFQWAGSPGRSSLTDRITREGQGHSGSKKIKHVCRTCNETWLSNQVEDAAKPTLTPLINGETMTVNADMQRILSTWAAKTVMTAEHVHPSKVVVHQIERTCLKDNLLPPAGWYIWIGTYGGVTWGELAIQQHAAKLRIPTIDNGNIIEHNLTFTIIGMRRLMFVVVSSSWPRMWDIIDGLGNPNVLCLSRIWPVANADIEWPRPVALTDTDADQMAATYLRDISAHPI
jgi:hypothetical protein